MENRSREDAYSAYATFTRLMASKESSFHGRTPQIDLPATKELGYCLKGARFFPLQSKNQSASTSAVLTSPIAPNPLLPV